MAGTIHKKTLREQVADEILDRIMNQKYSQGSRLVESALAREFGISHGPVREALRQLEQEGVVEYTRNSGCMVRSFSTIDTLEALIIRCSYEYTAVKAIDGKLSDEALSEIARVLDSIKSNDYSGYVKPTEIDIDFHKPLLKDSGMPHLLNAWSSFDYVITLAFYSVVKADSPILSAIYDRHKAIYDAYLTEDTDTICNAIFEHYYDNVCRMMDENGIREEDLPFSLDAIRP